MRQPALYLPSEVWSMVFRYLSPTDKFSVRASCRYFNKLVDHASLWKDWTVVLTFPNGPYSGQFWDTLRRRHVSSVVLRSRRVKQWVLASSGLPALSTLVIDGLSSDSIHGLKHFHNLKRLSVRNCPSFIRDVLILPRHEELTHLSLCDVDLSMKSLRRFIFSLSRFSNLTSLVCHQRGFLDDCTWMIHHILSCRPNLKHLSLSVRNSPYAPHVRPDPGPLKTASLLSSLELVDYTHESLPDYIMKLVPNLKSLAVFYKHSHHEAAGMDPPPVCQLTTWMSDLPHLSTLVVVRGRPVTEYVSCIPATVVSLTLCVAGISSKDLAAVAVQTPNLLHLHLDPWPSHLETHTSQIPQLFPKLKSLKLRHEHVPPKDFLCLHQLQALGYLEILDNGPQVSKLVGEFQALTDYRPQIKVCPRQKDVMFCSCVSPVLSKYAAD